MKNEKLVEFSRNFLFFIFQRKLLLQKSFLVYFFSGGYMMISFMASNIEISTFFRILLFFSPGTGLGMGVHRWAWIVWKNHKCSQLGRNVENIFKCNSSKPGPDRYHFCCGKFFSIQFVRACHVGASTEMN